MISVVKFGCQDFSALTLRLRQNGCHFAEHIFNSILLYENWCILIQISSTFFPKSPFSNNPKLVQIRAWHRTDNKPPSEPMIAHSSDIFVTHMDELTWNSCSISHQICVDFVVLCIVTTLIPCALLLRCTQYVLSLRYLDPIHWLFSLHIQIRWPYNLTILLQFYRLFNRRYC